MRRHAALDVARGLAVLGMVYVHLVGSRLANVLEGRPAALFCLLAGITWALSEGESRARRALVLGVFGALFHYTVWPTEVLVPLALMMVLIHHVRRGGQSALWLALVLVLLATPLIQSCFESAIARDWSDDGSHRADHALGWVTVRALVFDGNYPLLPWLAFPLLGSVAVRAGALARLPARRCFWGALALMVAAQLYTAPAGAPLVWQSTWVPTTLPFILLTGSSAVAVVAGLVWWEEARGLPRGVAPLALLGRASLTHYIGHLLLVFVLLRRLYPDEDWSAQVGLLGFLGYTVAALPLTALWFRRHRRGPLESLWHDTTRRIALPR